MSKLVQKSTYKEPAGTGQKTTGDSQKYSVEGKDAPFIAIEPIEPPPPPKEEEKSWLQKTRDFIVNNVTLGEKQKQLLLDLNTVQAEAQAKGTVLPYDTEKGTWYTPDKPVYSFGYNPDDGKFGVFNTVLNEKTNEYELPYGVKKLQDVLSPKQVDEYKAKFRKDTEADPQLGQASVVFDPKEVQSIRATGVAPDKLLQAYKGTGLTPEEALALVDSGVLRVVGTKLYGTFAKTDKDGNKKVYTEAVPRFEMKTDGTIEPFRIIKSPEFDWFGFAKNINSNPMLSDEEFRKIAQKTPEEIKQEYYGNRSWLQRFGQAINPLDIFSSFGAAQEDDVIAQYYPAVLGEIDTAEIAGQVASLLPQVITGGGVVGAGAKALGLGNKAIKAGQVVGMTLPTAMQNLGDVTQGRETVSQAAIDTGLTAAGNWLGLNLGQKAADLIGKGAYKAAAGTGALDVGTAVGTSLPQQVFNNDIAVQQQMEVATKQISNEEDRKRLLSQIGASAGQQSALTFAMTLGSFALGVRNNYLKNRRTAQTGAELPGSQLLEGDDNSAINNFAEKIVKEDFTGVKDDLVKQGVEPKEADNIVVDIATQYEKAKEQNPNFQAEIDAIKAEAALKEEALGRNLEGVLTNPNIVDDINTGTILASFTDDFRKELPGVNKDANIAPPLRIAVQELDPRAGKINAVTGQGGSTPKEVANLVDGKTPFTPDMSKAIDRVALKEEGINETDIAKALIGKKSLFEDLVDKTTATVGKEQGEQLIKDIFGTPSIQEAKNKFLRQVSGRTTKDIIDDFNGKVEKQQTQQKGVSADQPLQEATPPPTVNQIKEATEGLIPKQEEATVEPIVEPQPQAVETGLPQAEINPAVEQNKQFAKAITELPLEDRQSITKITKPEVIEQSFDDYLKDIELALSKTDPAYYKANAKKEIALEEAQVAQQERAAERQAKLDRGHTPETTGLKDTTPQGTYQAVRDGELNPDSLPIVNSGIVEKKDITKEALKNAVQSGVPLMAAAALPEDEEYNVAGFNSRDMLLLGALGLGGLGYRMLRNRSLGKAPVEVTGGGVNKILNAPNSLDIINAIAKKDNISIAQAREKFLNTQAKRMVEIEDEAAEVLGGLMNKAVNTSHKLNYKKYENNPIVKSLANSYIESFKVDNQLNFKPSESASEFFNWLKTNQKQNDRGFTENAQSLVVQTAILKHHEAQALFTIKGDTPETRAQVADVMSEKNVKFRLGEALGYDNSKPLSAEQTKLLNNLYDGYRKFEKYNQDTHEAKKHVQLYEQTGFKPEEAEAYLQKVSQPIKDYEAARTNLNQQLQLLDQEIDAATPEAKKGLNELKKKLTDEFNNSVPFTPTVYREAKETVAKINEIFRQRDLGKMTSTLPFWQNAMSKDFRSSAKVINPVTGERIQAWGKDGAAMLFAGDTGDEVSNKMNEHIAKRNGKKLSPEDYAKVLREQSAAQGKPLTEQEINDKVAQYGGDIFEVDAVNTAGNVVDVNGKPIKKSGQPASRTYVQVKNRIDNVANAQKQKHELRELTQKIYSALGSAGSMSNKDLSSLKTELRGQLDNAIATLTKLDDEDIADNSPIIKKLEDFRTNLIDAVDDFANVSVQEQAVQLIDLIHQGRVTDPTAKYKGVGGWFSDITEELPDGTQKIDLKKMNKFVNDMISGNTAQITDGGRLALMATKIDGLLKKQIKNGTIGNKLTDALLDMREAYNTYRQELKPQQLGILGGTSKVVEQGIETDVANKYVNLGKGLNAMSRYNSAKLLFANTASAATNFLASTAGKHYQIYVDRGLSPVAATYLTGKSMLLGVTDTIKQMDSNPLMKEIMKRGQEIGIFGMSSQEQTGQYPFKPTVNKIEDAAFWTTKGIERINRSGSYRLGSYEYQYKNKDMYDKIMSGQATEAERAAYIEGAVNSGIKMAIEVDGAFGRTDLSPLELKLKQNPITQPFMTFISPMLNQVLLHANGIKNAYNDGLISARTARTLGWYAVMPTIFGAAAANPLGYYLSATWDAMQAIMTDKNLTQEDKEHLAYNQTRTLDMGIKTALREFGADEQAISDFMYIRDYGLISALTGKKALNEGMLSPFAQGGVFFNQLMQVADGLGWNKERTTNLKKVAGLIFLPAVGQRMYKIYTQLDAGQGLDKNGNRLLGSRYNGWNAFGELVGGRDLNDALQYEYDTGNLWQMPTDQAKFKYFKTLGNNEFLKYTGGGRKNDGTINELFRTQPVLKEKAQLIKDNIVNYYQNSLKEQADKDIEAIKAKFDEKELEKPVQYEEFGKASEAERLEDNIKRTVQNYYAAIATTEVMKELGLPIYTFAPKGNIVEYTEQKLRKSNKQRFR